MIEDRNLFENHVYTPLLVAMDELFKRSFDVEYLSSQRFQAKKHLVMFRHIATPNYELHRFLSICDTYEMEPIIIEYLNDKFVPTNPCKYHLGKISIFNGYGKRGGAKIERINIINFNDSNGKVFDEINTIWGQRLHEFHHEIFFKRYGEIVTQSNVFDASKWFTDCGGQACFYYYEYLKLFLKDAILFENFMLENEDEKQFVENTFLPIFNKIYHEYGHKPLIVSLEPTDTENDEFWLSYPQFVKSEIQQKLNNC